MRKFIAFPCAEFPPAAPPVKDSLSVAERVSEEEGAQRPTLLHLHPADYRLIQAAACQKGFEVVEFIDPELERLQREVAERNGFDLVDHKLVLYVKPR